jgi:hypothetical protein
MKTNITAAEAKKTIIYFVEHEGHYEPRNHTLADGKVMQMASQFIPSGYSVGTDNLYDWVMASAEETTSPRGVENKLHVSEERYDVYQSINDKKEVTGDEYDDMDEEEQMEYEFKGEASQYIVEEWLSNGKTRRIEKFFTEEEADDYIFQMVYDYDFHSDDQRHTEYYATEAEAQAEADRMTAELESEKA